MMETQERLKELRSKCSDLHVRMLFIEEDIRAHEDALRSANKKLKSLTDDYTKLDEERDRVKDVLKGAAKMDLDELYKEAGTLLEKKQLLEGTIKACEVSFEAFVAPIKKELAQLIEKHNELWEKIGLEVQKGEPK